MTVVQPHKILCPDKGMASSDTEVPTCPIGEVAPATSKRDRRNKALAEERAAHPERFTGGSRPRRKRVWKGKMNYRVEITEEAGGVETITLREYPSLKALAIERNLCHDTLRHVLCNDRAGQAIKDKRYRCLKIERIGALGRRNIQS